MAKIYENSPLYLIGKKYVAWSFKQYFKEVIIIGRENIITNEAVIFAPNHLNALMDALAVLTLPPHDQVKVYLARADLFSLPPAIQKFLTFAKLMPAFRIRDGYENLGKNKESFDLSTKVLLHERALCIMPEGNQGEERKIRPLVKGIFRIAFDAQIQLPADKSVHIIPIGIEMNEWINPGGHLIMNIGKPIRVLDYMTAYAENPARAINSLKDSLQSELEKLIIHCGSEQYYDIYDTLIQLRTTDYLAANHLADNTLNRFYAAQHIAARLTEMEKTQPEAHRELAEKVRQLNNLLADNPMAGHNISMAQWQNADSTSSPILYHLRQTLLSITALPGILLNILPVKTIQAMPGLMGVKFRGFFSSVYYGTSIVLFPLFYTLQSILLLLLFNWSAWLFIPVVLVHYISGKIAFGCLKRRTENKQEWMVEKQKGKAWYVEMKKLMGELGKILF
jgi:1-acyl-sn-glycerol-3-phosphate acyltransferase